MDLIEIPYAIVLPFWAAVALWGREFEIARKERLKRLAGLVIRRKVRDADGRDRWVSFRGDGTRLDERSIWQRVQDGEPLPEHLRP